MMIIKMMKNSEKFHDTTEKVGNRQQAFIVGPSIFNKMSRTPIFL